MSHYHSLVYRLFGWPEGTVVLGSFAFMLSTQCAGAPVVDGVIIVEREGRRRWWKGYAIHLSPWRKDEYGDRASGKSLVVGKYVGEKTPDGFNVEYI